MKWRHIPHPTYGNFGGRKQTAERDVQPIDWMDCAFKQHDQELKDAGKNETLVDEADCMLAERLWDGNSKHLARPIYGRIYRLGTIIVFSIVCFRM